MTHAEKKVLTEESEKGVRKGRLHVPMDTTASPLTEVQPGNAVHPGDPDEWRRVGVVGPPGAYRINHRSPDRVEEPIAQGGSIIVWMEQKQPRNRGESAAESNQTSRLLYLFPTLIPLRGEIRERDRPVE